MDISSVCILGGSGFVGQSVTAERVRTTVAPAIAPAAAAVAPFTNARTCALSWWRTNHLPGTTTPR